MRWAIEIKKTSLERRNLSDLLHRLGFNIVEGIKYPALTSPKIDSCLTAMDVFNESKDVQEKFDVAQVDTDFTLGAVIDYSTNPPREHVFVELCDTVRVGDECFVTVLPPKGLSPTELEQWKMKREEQEYQAKLEQQVSNLEPLFSCKGKEAVRVSKLLSTDKPNGEILYKIYEIAEGHRDNRKMFHPLFGIDEDQFKRFKDAIHNPSVTGDFARHGYHDNPKTSNPMTKEEAESFVRDIANKWLQSLRKPFK